MARATRPKQLDLPSVRERATTTAGHGGARRGAGRKKRSDESIPHTARPAIDGDHPVHITIRIARGVWNLRSQRGFRAVRDALEQEKKRGDLRIVEFTVQGDHLHLIAEVADRLPLTRRMQGFGTRFARSVNAMMGRTRGRVIAERYHLHVLRSPREARNAVRYVLLNHVKHFGKGSNGAVSVDPFSSGPWFQHFAAGVQPSRWRPCLDPPTRPPESWLLRTGWRRARGAVG